MIGSNVNSQIKLFLLWFKYYRLENTTYDNLANTSLENNIFMFNDIQTATEKSKEILSQKYNIKIESLSPLILSSNLSFPEINEKP